MFGFGLVEEVDILITNFAAHKGVKNVGFQINHIQTAKLVRHKTNAEI